MKRQDCPDIEKIQGYIDNSLSFTDAKYVASHITVCVSCQKACQTFTSFDEAAGRFAHRQLSAKAPPKIVKQIMQKIDQREPAGQKQPDFSNLLKWLFAPALALSIILILPFFLNNREKPAVSTISEPFSLSQNSLKLIVSEPEAFALIDKEKGPEKIELSRLEKAEKNQRIKLPAKTTIMLSVNKHRIRIFNQAEFMINNRQFYLFNGSAEIDLSGNHDGFELVTPDFSITPLGTSFSVDMKPAFSIVRLRTGAIKIINKLKYRRKLTEPQTLFIDKNGNFHNKVPQKENSLINSAEHQPPVDNLGTPPANNGSDSPGRLLDSF